jgi:hypothetical protein
MKFIDKVINTTKNIHNCDVLISNLSEDVESNNISIYELGFHGDA